MNIQSSAAVSLQRRVEWAVLFTPIILAALAYPAWAHHPFGGEQPQTFLQGILSGVGHPVIGFDHLAFVIGTGLLAAVLTGKGKALGIIGTFVTATILGTGIHLAGASLPVPELVISASVLMIGIFTVTRARSNIAVMIVLIAIAGVFHGYAYGEAVVGAEPTPLVGYLIGFGGVQSVIAYLTSRLASNILSRQGNTGWTTLRHAGFVIVGAGAAFVGGLLG